MKRKQILTHIIVPAIIGGLFLLMISPYGAYLLFVLFPISDGSNIPEAVLVGKAQELEEVKAFLTKYPDSFDGTDQWEVPYLVVFVALKSDFEGLQRTDAPFGQPLIRLLAQVDSDMVARNATIYCFYARNDTSGEQIRYQISKENIVKYLNELENAHCWDLPPPAYAESIRSIIRTPPSNATNID